MICIFRSARYMKATMAVGIIIIMFGVVGNSYYSESSGNEAMLFGMLSGFGAAWTILGAIFMMRNKFTPAEKLKQDKINAKDERNIQIFRASYATANTACTIMLALMSFLFVGLGYRVAAFITIGAIILQTLVFSISYLYYSKRM